MFTQMRSSNHLEEKQNLPGIPSKLILLLSFVHIVRPRKPADLARRAIILIRTNSYFLLLLGENRQTKLDQPPQASRPKTAFEKVGRDVLVTEGQK